MHTIQRLIVTAVLLTLLLPLSTLAIVEMDAHHEAAEKLDAAIEQAAHRYQVRTRVSAGSTVDVAEAEKALQEIAREKRGLRLQIASRREDLATLGSLYNIDLWDVQQREATVDTERESFVPFVRLLQARTAVYAPKGDQALSRLLKQLLVASLGSITEQDTQVRVLRQTRVSLINDLIDAQEHIAELIQLEEQHRELQEEYASIQDDIHSAQYAVGGTVQDAAQRVWAEVHAQVLRLQSDLARIDARLRSRAERKLIEKGLLAPQPGEHSTGEIVPYTPQFTWPAYGRISAGFMDPDYQKFFGIPHRGSDIAIAQGSTVVSSADGVVFLARDGGAHGYSYVLIGHRGGYATLYGHLSTISVSAGQDVVAGERIGLSGGQPGTHGAGPTTTGPHLHFEIIKNGVNINPLSILP
ncbi:MAG: peptidoglycan DD-metalloendopeptidase family protein [Candidatus Peribacteraceae bacterium]|jgi:murein DD-endopeptidase MepM/ murein hydrolase activator NlpD